MLELPLFPLPESVVFPGMTVPLFVFEARYRRLVRDSLAQEPSQFVIVLSRSDAAIADGEPSLHSVGTVVDILTASENPDGSFHLLAHGQGRCRVAPSREVLVAEPDGSSRPLYYTLVEDLPLLREDPNSERLVIWDALETFHAYADLFFASDAREQVDQALPDDPVFQASFICANLRLPAASRQVLLEAPTLSARFQLARRLMAERIDTHQTVDG